MRLRTRLAALWKDPVGSNVIAGLIIAAAGYLFVWLTNTGSSPFLVHPLAKLGIPAVILVVTLLLWQRFRPTRRTLIFLSAGGTCRDPMAKAIMTKLLAASTRSPRINVLAAGVGPISAGEASYAARYVIREMYGEDLLKEHRPQQLTPDLVAHADLILVMDKSLLLTPGKTLPPNKAFVPKEFFGLRGDVADPWPDGKDAATLDRYRACAEELRTLLTQHFDRIVDVFKT
jgi:protein-tyrosine-phosphatase